MKYILRWLGLMCFLSLMAAGLAIALTGSTKIVLAAAAQPSGPMGRPWHDDYFTGASDPYPDYVLDPEGQTQYDGLAPGCGTNNCSMNAASFIQAYQVRLFDSTSQVNEGRAAAAVDIMLGIPGPTFNNSIATGIAYAQAHFTQWADLVNEYASGTIPGYSVQWNVDNLYYTSDAMGATALSPGAYCNSTNLKCIGDVTFIQTLNDSNVDLGVIFDANGQQLIIKYKCGNMEGTVNYLPSPTSSVTITKSSTHPAAMNVGTTMDYNLAIREATDIPLRQVTITDALPPEFHYVASVNGSPTPSVSGNTLSWSFSAPVDNIILSAIASGSENLSFEVKAVADGTAVNTATGTATDAVGGPETVIPGTVTNTVVQATTPAFEGLNGDVQAGGGPCGGQLSSGFVAGFSNADSYATYAVSATGSISNFSSNSGHNNLTLGASGGYNKVCEPDLYVAVQNGFKTTPGTTLPANSATHPYDISNWSGVYYITGNAYITASSVVSNKMTIVAMGGSVYIRGTIALTNVAKTPSTAPSVGIIAADNINIAAPVTRVDAYMSADGTIDTCQSGTGSCLSNLTVNGFLMGNNILFNRLGPANGNGSPVAEKVALNPQIYLNPPVFFDTAHTESIPLIGQGEGQPLF